MDGLGDKLQRLRLARKLSGPKIARRALGPDATKTQIKSFANYLSRIEKGRERNPSLLKLEQLARGFGDATLGDFFIDLERSPNSLLKGAAKAGEDPLVVPGGPHGDLVSALLPRVLYELSDQLLEAADRTRADRTVADRPAANPRPGKSKRSEPRH